MSHRFPLSGLLYLELDTGERIKLARTQALVLEPDLGEAEEVSLSLNLRTVPAMAPGETVVVRARPPAVRDGGPEPAPAADSQPRPSDETEKPEHPPARGNTTAAPAPVAEPQEPVPFRRAHVERAPLPPPAATNAAGKRIGRKACKKCNMLNYNRARECGSCGAKFPQA